MKKLFLILLASLFLVVGRTTFANAVTLAWDANTDSVVGYKVYYQETGTPDLYSEVVQGRENVIYTIEDNKFHPGQEYEFWVTAFNDALESGSSNIVTWTAPLFTPTDNPAPVIIQVPGTPASVTINIGTQ